jgi:hypothetical protein
MGAEGQNLEMSLVEVESSLFSYSSTYAIRASKEEQTVTVTTLGVATYGEATVPADVEEGGSFSFNPTTMGLGTLLATYGNSPIKLTHGANDILVVYCGSTACESSFNNLGQSVTVSPQEMGATTCELTMPADVFIPAVTTVLPFAIAASENAPILNAAHIYESAGGAVKIVAADRKRVARTGLEVHSQTGSLGNGVTISSRVLKSYVSAAAKLMNREDLLSAKTTLTLGQDGRYFLCADSADGKTKICLQYCSIHGEYPEFAKGRFCKGDADYKVIIKSIKALGESFNPVAVFAASLQEQMFALQIEPSLVRFALQSRGSLMHSSIAATSAVRESVQIALNAQHIRELIASIKDAGEATVSISVWQDTSGVKVIFGLLTNPSFEHFTIGMTPGPGVDIATWFAIAAPLRQKVEKEVAKSRGAAAAEAEPTVTAAKTPAARKIAKKGAAKPAPAATAAKPPAAKAATKKGLAATPPAPTWDEQLPLTVVMVTGDKPATK